MFESHRPFIRTILERTNHWKAKDIEAFLDGSEMDNDDEQQALAKAFEAWTYGDSAKITVAVSDYIPKPTTK